MEQSTRSAWPRLLLAGVASAIIMLSFLIPLVRSFMNPRATPLTAAGDEDELDLSFKIQRGDTVLPGHSGDVVLAGDRIRFTYTSEREAEFALLRASFGQAQVAYPRSTMTVRLPAARDAALELEVEIERRAGTEHVFGSFCDAPLELEPVRALLQKSEDLLALPGCRVRQLTLHKKLP